MIEINRQHLLSDLFPPLQPHPGADTLLVLHDPQRDARTMRDPVWAVSCSGGAGGCGSRCTIGGGRWFSGHPPPSFLPWKWPGAGSISNALPQMICSVSGAAKELFLCLQRGIFPVILNKLLLSVHGIQIRVAGLMQMQIRRHKGN